MDPRRRLCWCARGEGPHSKCHREQSRTACAPGPFRGRSSPEKSLFGVCLFPPPSISPPFVLRRRHLQRGRQSARLPESRSKRPHHRLQGPFPRSRQCSPVQHDSPRPPPSSTSITFCPRPPPCPPAHFLLPRRSTARPPLSFVMSTQRRGASSPDSRPSRRPSPSSTLSYSTPKSLSTLAVVGLVVLACLSPVVKAALYEPPGNQVLFGAWLDTDIGTFSFLLGVDTIGRRLAGRLARVGCETRTPRWCDGRGVRELRATGAPVSRGGLGRTTAEC